MKHININIKLFLATLGIGLVFLTFYNNHNTLTGHSYVKKDMTITLTGYQTGESMTETYFKIDLNNETSGYTVYDNTFLRYIEAGNLKLGDFVEYTDYCLVEDGKLVYLKSTNDDVLNAFKKKYSF